MKEGMTLQQLLHGNEMQKAEWCAEHEGTDSIGYAMHLAAAEAALKWKPKPADLRTSLTSTEDAT